MLLLPIADIPEISEKWLLMENLFKNVVNSIVLGHIIN